MTQDTLNLFTTAAEPTTTTPEQERKAQACSRATPGKDTVPMKNQKQIIDHLEALISIAAGKGYGLRGYTKGPGEDERRPELVKHHCRCLDALGCPWIVQNTILAYINDIDRQEVWESLFKSSWREIAAEALTA